MQDLLREFLPILQSFASAAHRYVDLRERTDARLGEKERKAALIADDKAVMAERKLRLAEEKAMREQNKHMR